MPRPAGEARPRSEPPPPPGSARRWSRAAARTERPGGRPARAAPSRSARSAPHPAPRPAPLGAAAGSIAAGPPGDAAALRTKALGAVTLWGFAAARTGPYKLGSRSRFTRPPPDSLAGAFRTTPRYPSAAVPPGLPAGREGAGPCIPQTPPAPRTLPRRGPSALPFGRQVPRGRMRVFPWGFWLLCVASAPARADSSKARSCAELRQLYGAKGFSLSGVPQAEISGEHLRICPQGYTCCTSEMEENFANKSRSEFEAMVKEAGRLVQMTLTAQHRSFDSYFQDLLNKSEKALYDAFPSMYGELYTQNMKVFKDLYSELRRYYRGSNINLEEALNEFWTRLLERLFKLMNPQYHITDEYLDCMVKHAEQHKPFGEVPRDLKVKATRAFIAARSYAQGFLVGSDVVKKVSQVSLGHECTRAIMKLMYCPHCRGMSSVKPCNNYCLNVMKGCLANQADLNTEWKYLMDSLVVVADRIDGPYSVDTVIGTIHMRISEAISNLQENKDSITAKVFQGCGNPKISTKGSSSEDKKRRGKVVLEAKSSAQALEMLVQDAKGNLTALKTYWITLPGSLCSKRIMASSAADDKCWNGMTKGSYLPEVMGDGLANQINNPEVEVDITKPDMTIRQQIMQLKIMTNRLGNANIGNDVDFQDASDDMSGSGSGDSCPDDVCGKRLSKSPSTRQPETHAIPKQSGHGIPGASSRSLPSAFLLLLSVALIATQHLWR